MAKKNPVGFDRPYRPSRRKNPVTVGRHQGSQEPASRALRDVMKRRNPLIQKKGRGKNTTLVMGDKPLRDIAALDKLPDYNQEETNALLLPALHEIPGGMSICFVQNYFPTTQIAYFLKDPQDKDAAVQAIQSGNPGILMFNRHRPSYGSVGTIEQFWSGKGHRKLTNFLLGAIQFFKVPEDPSTVPAAENFLEPGNPEDWLNPGDLVITHMSTKNAYQRGGLNTYMVRSITEELFKGDFRRLLFEDLTPDGKAFAKQFERRFPRYGNIYHFGQMPSGGRKVYPLDYYDNRLRATARKNPSAKPEDGILRFKTEAEAKRWMRDNDVLAMAHESLPGKWIVVYHDNGKVFALTSPDEAVWLEEW